MLFRIPFLLITLVKICVISAQFHPQKFLKKIVDLNEKSRSVLDIGDTMVCLYVYVYMHLYIDV
jgi:hypothetical protein